MRLNLAFFSGALLLSPATIVIGLFIVVPFLLIVVMSFSSAVGDGSTVHYSLTNYQQLLSPLFIRQSMFSVALAVLVSALCLIVTVPFVYFLSGFGRRLRTVLLVFILAQSSLSEVLISFSWQVLLARTTGVSNLLVMVGLLDAPVSLVPSFPAVTIALVYMVIPFAVLILFPAFSRLDRSLVEAARTMGATGLQAFRHVVLPVCRPSLIACGLSIYILTLGSVIIPQLLGNPRHWTIAVHITDQALSQFNPPFAAALAMMLLGISVVLLAALWLGSRRSE